MNYPEQCRTLLELCKKLNTNGYKKKELAAILEIPAPVFSSLINTVLPLIAAINPNDPEEETKISDAFSQVNNMSLQKTLNALGTYIDKFQRSLSTRVNATNELDYLSIIKHHARESYEYIKQYYEGVYYLYYESSSQLVVKREPIQLKANPIEKIIEVVKGNQLSSLTYKGIATLAGKHTIVIHLVEANESPQEYLMINLSLPFIRKSNYLRGTFSSLSFATQPISRKIVIHKVEENMDIDDFHEIETRYYQDGEEADFPEIHNYILSEPSKVECYSIPNPKFDTHDLTREVELRKHINAKK